MCFLFKTRYMKQLLKNITLGLFLLIGISAKATTWYEVTLACPVCQDSSTYYSIGSYGSYIYQWSSKYQYVYWPNTTTNVLYCCVHCKYTAFMYDFKKLPADKIETVKATLKQWATKKRKKRYTDIPIMERFEIAEVLYQLLNKDDAFWSKFYRVKGYHAALQGLSDVAIQSRKKSLTITYRQLQDSSQLKNRKEHYFIIGSMYYFTNQRDSALFYFEASKPLVYEDASLSKKQGDNFNHYLTELATEFSVAIIEKKEIEIKDED